MATRTAIRRLRDVRLTDALNVGAKAASLGELLAMGVQVPDGVVLDVRGGELSPDERREMLGAAVADLGGGPFAVRSSGVGEDGAAHSYAGMYETVLSVDPAELPAAADQVLASARAARVGEYEGEPHGRMAVLIQQMIAPVAAGVALTADPITGDRTSTIVTAVRGIGERLVSGSTVGDEWAVRDGRATARRQPEHALDARQAAAVADEARRIASVRGAPQDVEWAIDGDGVLWILQARPMTALPPEVSWQPPAGGSYTRQLRFGEWIGAPVTPLFESWLLPRMEERLHARIKELLGQRAPKPLHVVVNGWYFYSLNWISPSNMLRSLPSIVVHVLREPRRSAGVIPPTARFSVKPLVGDWREDVQPRYRAAAVDADARVETVPIAALPAFIDGLSDLAGEYAMSIAAVSGLAYKLEMVLARFYRTHVAPTLGGSHLPLLSGFEPPDEPARHAVASIDWWYPVDPDVGTGRPSPDEHAQLVATRKAAEEAAFTVLASSPRQLRKFRELLALAQQLVPVREEQTAEWTIVWPAMRRAVVRIGEALADQGAIARPDDVFFLTRAEVVAALEGRPMAGVDVAARRARREEQARLVPPNTVGKTSRAMQAIWDSYPRMVGAAPSDRALVTGTPASAGRATGPVRIIRTMDEFDQLQAGDILVAPLTAPAWTPLFTRAAAVVTDVGSAAAHASIIAREYGIPAVVGCGDATARLRNGMRVTVDGGTGNVEPE